MNKKQKRLERILKLDSATHLCELVKYCKGSTRLRDELKYTLAVSTFEFWDLATLLWQMSYLPESFRIPNVSFLFHAVYDVSFPDTITTLEILRILKSIYKHFSPKAKFINGKKCLDREDLRKQDATDPAILQQITDDCIKRAEQLANGLYRWNPNYRRK